MAESQASHVDAEGYSHTFVRGVHPETFASLILEKGVYYNHKSINLNGMNSMKTKIFTLIVWVFGLLLPALSVVGASELPPLDSKPLSVILKSVEEQKLGVIREAEFDHGLWEVKVCDSGPCQKLCIDPISGKEKGRRKSDIGEIPPANATPISMIVQSIEARRLGVIEEVEFDHGSWEIELHKRGRENKLYADPKTGEIRR